MEPTIPDIARALADRAEAVCRHYLSQGRRQGAYWTAGSVDNVPGQSLFVRLGGQGAGRWQDAATGDHGDLLDLIAATCRLPGVQEALREAKRFLGLMELNANDRACPVVEPSRSLWAARRLWEEAQPVPGTLAERYLRGRGLHSASHWPALRFHPACPYAGGPQAGIWPALVCGVRDWEGALTGVQRTYLDPSGDKKAPVETPRRALGSLMGRGVVMGEPGTSLVVGEGVETTLSFAEALPGLQLCAALSAAGLGRLELPSGLRRLIAIMDNDKAGMAAGERLVERARHQGIDVQVVLPVGADLNDDLMAFGPEGVREQLSLILSA